MQASTPDPAESPAFDPALSVRVRRRVFLRLIPWLFVLYVVAYLDRVNVSYATLEMSADLSFSPKVYGFGAGIFFVGYCLLEIPGAVIAVRWGVRKWICRIMVSWGIVAMGMGFIQNATQFYWLRFLLGVAEAGFFPAIIIYLTTWFTAQDRAKAIGVCMSATSVAVAIGGPVSVLLMKLDWFGLAGWRWLFILEGVPAVVLGLASLFVMTDRPAAAGWLTEAEKKHLERELEEERQRQRAREGPAVGIVRALAEPRVLILAAAYFAGQFVTNGLALWLPTIVKAASGRSNLAVSILVSLPFVLGVLSKIAIGWSSDRLNERRWHAVITMVLSATALVVSTLVTGNLGAGLICMCVAVAGAHAYMPVFWAHTSSLLGGMATAAAVGLINSIGNLGGSAGSSIIGWTKEASDSFATGVLCLAGSAMAAAMLILYATFVRPKERLRTPLSRPCEQPAS